jgi:hypothetical protein
MNRHRQHVTSALASRAVRQDRWQACSSAGGRRCGLARYEGCVSACARARRRGQRAAQSAAAPSRDQLTSLDRPKCPHGVIKLETIGNVLVDVPFCPESGRCADIAGLRIRAFSGLLHRSKEFSFDHSSRDRTKNPGVRGRGFLGPARIDLPRGQTTFRPSAAFSSIATNSPRRQATHLRREG